MADLIDRQALLRDIEKYHLSDGKFQHWVEVQPSVEAEPVVRRKDCKWKDGAECLRFADVLPFPHDFCSRGERKPDGRLN